MNNIISIPIKYVNKARWSKLGFFGGNRHEICAESMKVKKGKYSFAGEHRVCLYTVKDNVHWKIPDRPALTFWGGTRYCFRTRFLKCGFKGRARPACGHFVNFQ